MSSSCFRGRRRGVTLLEVVLSMGILVFLSSITYWFYSSALGTRERDTSESQKLQMMRIILQRMATEIRQVSRITTEGRVGLRGEAEQISLSTIRVPSRDTAWFYGLGDEPPPAGCDMVTVEYRIARHPEILHEDGYPEAIGLARVEQEVPRAEVGPTAFSTGGDPGDPQDTGDGADFGAPQLVDEESRLAAGVLSELDWDELYSKDIKFLRFCYFDGYRWWDDWDITGENPLPQMVMVTLGFEQRPPFDAEFGVRDREAEEFCTCMNRDPVDCLPLKEDQFSITVRLPQADVFFRSRVNREMKSILEEAGTAEEGTGDGSGKGGGT